MRAGKILENRALQDATVRWPRDNEESPVHLPCNGVTCHAKASTRCPIKATGWELHVRLPSISLELCLTFRPPILLLFMPLSLFIFVVSAYLCLFLCPSLSLSLNLSLCLSLSMSLCLCLSSLYLHVCLSLPRVYISLL